MPTIYLSPSTQEYNLSVLGPSEEYYMNLIADAMEPYLRASGIDFVRNTPAMTAGSSIRASNAGNYDAHVALHSNAAPEALAGQLQGPDIYYFPSSTNGKRLAESLADTMRAIYPQPALVDTRPTTTLGEVSKTRAPAVLIEYAYHDNPDDAQWIASNIDALARQTVRALTDYFGIPFREPASEVVGMNSTPSPFAQA